MSGPDTFFVSDSLVDLLGEPDITPKKTYVEIEGIKALFLSYTSVGRLLKIEIEKKHNPFELFESTTLNTSIVFPNGVNKILKYTTPSFKIEQSKDSWRVAIGDKDE